MFYGDQDSQRLYEHNYPASKYFSRTLSHLPYLTHHPILYQLLPVTAKRPLKPLHENLCKNMARSAFTTPAHIAHLIPLLCSNLLKAT